ncbi:MAG TPA: preprotein translocase subunit SecG [Candidatus Saccharimonadia bacterium]
MHNFFNIITVISSALLVLCILIQTRGQSLGATFGGETSYYRSRRGAEAVIFNATIVLAVVFVLSVILSLLAKK